MKLTGKTRKIGEFPGLEDLVIAEGMGASWNRVPFPHDTYFAVAGQRVYVSDTAEPEVAVLDPEGRVERRIRWKPPGSLATKAALEAALERWLTAQGEGARRRLERIYRDHLPPDRALPVHGRLVTAEDGTLWVKQGPFPEDWAEPWLVFGPEGEVLARVTLPTNSRLLHPGKGEVLLRQTDSLGVETVAVFRTRVRSGQGR